MPGTLIRRAFDSWKLATPFPLFSLLVIRPMLTAFPDGNHRYDIIKGVVYTEDIHIVVVLTGVLVFLECLASILSFWYHLGLRPLIRATHIKDLKDWHVPIIVVLTVGSILHATWIFMLVRRIWVSHFFVLIQFLQAVPNILLVTQSISQGVYLICAYAKRRNNAERNREPEDFSPHMKSHRRLNLILLAYSFTMLVTMFVPGENISPSLVQVYFFLGVLEIISRLFSVYATSELSEPPNAANAVYEADYEVPIEATNDTISVADSMVIVTEPMFEQQPSWKPFITLKDNEDLPQNHEHLESENYTLSHKEYSKLRQACVPVHEERYQEWKSEGVVGML